MSRTLLPHFVLAACLSTAAPRVAVQGLAPARSRHKCAVPPGRLPPCRRGPGTG
jgi:hypothetical protein